MVNQCWFSIKSVLIQHVYPKGLCTHAEPFTLTSYIKMYIIHKDFSYWMAINSMSNPFHWYQCVLACVCHKNSIGWKPRLRPPLKQFVSCPAGGRTCGHAGWPHYLFFSFFKKKKRGKKRFPFCSNILWTRNNFCLKDGLKWCRL